MASTDYNIIQGVINSVEHLREILTGEALVDVYREHPLDENSIQSLRGFLEIDENNEFAIFKKVDQIKSLWKDLIKKSINCLRYYDTREPFHDNIEKHPHAYGLDELEKYFDKYTEFEALLYGGSKYYRDHVVHVFRVWLIGIKILLENGGDYLSRVKIEDGYTINSLEKISIWTITALTHDLGYPLEKALQIIEKTQDMMKSFIVNPIVSMDLSFNGVQNTMNDYVLRFVSSKMHRRIGDNLYVARLQPKYYFKYQKSLENNSHGILSALIIYKMLVFFLESDYSINEDYTFTQEDSRQFYIRREILRSIASHTCHDVYQLTMFSFSFLLILCDDAQEWGRKSISDLYIERGEIYSFEGIENTMGLEGNTCTLMDKYKVDKTSSIKRVLERFEKQSKTYRDVFRDGQETTHRDFNFTRQIEIDVNNPSTNKNYILKLLITTDKQTTIIAKRTNDAPLSEKEEFCKTFKEVFGLPEYNDDHTRASIVL